MTFSCVIPLRPGAGRIIGALGGAIWAVSLIAADPARFSSLDSLPLDFLRRPGMEARPLFDGQIEKIWSAAESSTVAETNRAQPGMPWLRWRIVVDHLAGEPKYPIGWPRLWRPLREGERDWSGWDYLEVLVRADTSRENLPSTPVALLIRAEGEASWSRPLTELRKGQWGKFVIPLWELPKPSAVNQLMFSISDAHYRHGDQVEFTIAGLALTRHESPTLLDFAAEQTALFADAPGLPVRFRVAGLKPGETAAVEAEWRQAGRLISRRTVTAGRGRQTMVFDFGGKPLSAGEYEVSARIAATPAQTERVRLLESPWQEQNTRP